MPTVSDVMGSQTRGQPLALESESSLHMAAMSMGQAGRTWAAQRSGSPSPVTLLGGLPLTAGSRSRGRAS